MTRSTTRWPIAAAAAALLAMPGAATAQSQSAPQQNPPSQTQPPQQQPPPSQTPPAQPQQQTTPPPPAAAGQVDQAAAKEHLMAARESLSQLTSLPEAAKLQGDNRTMVSQLISNFNELITAQSNWRASYDKVDASLKALVGAESGEPGAASATAGAVGTTGAAGSPAIDPAIRTKLVEFRTHLKAFEQAAGGGAATEGRPDDATAAGAMPPAAATASTANPSNPAGNPAAANPGQPPTTAGATGTSGVTTSPTGSMNTADQARASEQVSHAEADKHLDAISAILDESKTGTLTRAQTVELKKHVAELRRLLQQGQ